MVERCGQVRRAVDGHRGQELAVVAEHDVVSGAGVDPVPRSPADYYVVPAAGGDGVAAADAGGQADDRVDVGRVAVGRHVVDGTVVSECDVVPAAQVDAVGVGAAQHEVVAPADCYEVRPAVVEGSGLEPPQGHGLAGELAGGTRRRGDLPAVADHQVPTVARVDRVAEAAADDDVVAGTTGDDIRPAAEGGRGTRDEVHVCGVAVGVVDDDPVVTQHDVVVGGRDRPWSADRDCVAFGPAHHDVAAGPGGDRVGTSHAVGGRLDAADGDRQAAEPGAVGRRGDDPSVVAEDDVAAAAGVDPVAARPADYYVVPAAGGDRVAAADAGGQAQDRVDVGRVAVGRHGVHQAAVAEDDVVPGAGVDQVRTVARQNDVVAGAAVDGVRVAVGVLGGFDPRRRAGVNQPKGAGRLGGLPRRLRHDPVVAEEDVGTGVAANGVAAGGHVVAVRRVRDRADGDRGGALAGVGGRHGNGAGVAVGAGGGAECAGEDRVEAGVAVNDVVAAVAADHVVAAAAGEGVAALAAGDGVVVEAAVDRHPGERGAGVDRVPVVAGDHREVAAVGGRGARHVVVLAAVLGRVPVDHERRGQRHGGRGRTRGRSHGDGVVAGTAVDDRDAALHPVRRHRPGDREGVVADTEQDVEDFHGVVGRAARATEAGQGGPGERADIVRRAAVVEDVQAVDRVRLVDRRQVRAERSRVRLGRQDDGLGEGTVRPAAREPLDLEGPADRDDHVRLEGEGHQGRRAGRIDGADDGQGHVPRDAERVVAEVADGRRHHARARAEDEQGVVALQAVDLQGLHPRVGGVEAGPEHAGVGDHEVVAQLGTQDRDRVGAVAAVDGNRRVQVILKRDRR